MVTKNMCPLFKIDKNTNGSVSVAFVAFMLLMFSTLGYVSYSVMTSDSQLSVRSIQKSQSRYLAEAGVEYAIKKLTDGDTLSDHETLTIESGAVTIQKTQSGNSLLVNFTGEVGNASKTIQLSMLYRPPISGYAIYSTGEISNVDALNEAGNPDPNIMVENAMTLPTIDNQAMIDTATAQSHVYAVSTFEPNHGYPNFNFYYSGNIPNVTYVDGDLRVRGGRTVYGIFMVEGDIRLDGSSRVEGVLYMLTPDRIIIHGGGSPSESSVTGGVVANGNVDGTGSHITVHYRGEYMNMFGAYENRVNAIMSMRWREL